MIDSKCTGVYLSEQLSTAGVLMSIGSYSLGGVYPYKMDAKCRVSIPVDWRGEIGGGLLRLLEASNEDQPIIKVLTESEFERILNDIEAREWSPAQKRKARGIVFERIVKTHLNDQGKLSIPKQFCERPGLVAGKGLYLVGRGDYIEISNEESHLKIKAASESFEEEMSELGIF